MEAVTTKTAPKKRRLRGPTPDEIALSLAVTAPSADSSSIATGVIASSAVSGAITSVTPSVVTSVANKKRGPAPDAISHSTTVLSATPISASVAGPTTFVSPIVAAAERHAKITPLNKRIRRSSLESQLSSDSSDTSESSSAESSEESETSSQYSVSSRMRKQEFVQNISSSESDSNVGENGSESDDSEYQYERVSTFAEAQQFKQPAKKTIYNTPQAAYWKYIHRRFYEDIDNLEVEYVIHDVVLSNEGLYFFKYFPFNGDGTVDDTEGCDMYSSCHEMVQPSSWVQWTEERT